MNKYGIQAPIIVYQMGKVGSRSVYESLNKLGLDVPVYHCHVLNHLEKVEQGVRQLLTAPEESLQVVREGQQLRELILADKDRKWNLVSLVREPVARNVSHFFHAVTERIPEFYQRLENKTLEMDYLSSMFLKDEQVNLTCGWWFNSQVKDLFGIDVYARRFNRKRGYKIYEGEHARLLVMRLESLEQCLQPAMKDFLGIDEFPLDKHNLGEDKEYAEVYKRFKAEKLVPIWYMLLFHQTRYARHFYTHQELKSLRQPWINQPAGNSESAIISTANAAPQPNLPVRHTPGVDVIESGRSEHKYGITAPIIVYQMGKVGSMSVYESLKKLDLDVPVYHCHVLNHLDQVESRVKATMTNPVGTLAVVEQGKQIRELMLADPQRRWNLVSLVREPVARNVSHFFQSITERIPDFYQRLENETLDMDYLSSMFLKDEQVNLACWWWFKSQVLDLFGIDIYAQPFPKRRGYQIFEGDRVRLLVMRLENLDKCLRPAMQQFLGITDFDLGKHNAGEDKNYAEVYKRFKTQGLVPRWYFQLLHQSRFARHFYTPAELARFRQAWNNPPAEPGSG